MTLQQIDQKMINPSVISWPLKLAVKWSNWIIIYMYYNQ